MDIVDHISSSCGCLWLLVTEIDDLVGEVPSKSLTVLNYFQAGQLDLTEHFGIDLFGVFSRFLLSPGPDEKGHCKLLFRRVSQDVKGAHETEKWL